MTDKEPTQAEREETDRRLEEKTRVFVEWLDATAPDCPSAVWELALAAWLSCGERMDERGPVSAGSGVMNFTTSTARLG